MGRRRRSREIALQILYEMEMVQIPPDQAISLVYEHFEAPSSSRPFTENLVLGVVLHRKEIDQLIAAASEHWRIDRMSIVDRNILRIALFEMLHCEDIPPKVSINEAIDLGKTFGTEDSGAFINGILDHMLLELKESRRIPGDRSPS